MATSWKGQSPAAFGVGQGLINAAEGFSKNFFRGQEIKDALAQKAAELTATQRHQKRIEDLQAQALADRKEMEKQSLRSKGILEGAPKGYFEALDPASAAEQSAPVDARNAEVRRRYETAQQHWNKPVEMPLGQTAKPFNAEIDDLDVFNARKTAEPIHGDAIQGTSPELESAKDFARAAAKAEMFKREVAAERPAPVIPSAPPRAPIRETPLADAVIPTMSTQGRAAAAAADERRSAKIAEADAKRRAEIEKTASKIAGDINVAGIRGEYQLASANAANQAARAMAALAKGQYQDFKKSVEMFKMVDPETGNLYNPFMNADGTANYELGKSTFELFSKPASATASMGGMKEGLKPLQDEVDQLNRNIGELEKNEAWVSSPNGQGIIDQMKARRGTLTGQIQSGSSGAPMGGGVGSFNPVVKQPPPSGGGGGGVETVESLMSSRGWPKEKAEQYLKQLGR